jgi:hypothetical protein
VFSIPWYIFLLQFIAGLFLSNGVPHFVQGQRRLVPDPALFTTWDRRILARSQRVVGIS